MGSLISAKGIFELEDILRQLHSKNIPFLLHIIGSGAEEAQLKATLKAFETVSFKGKLLNTEVLELHQNHDIILLPSKTEGLPVVLVEAMKYGVVPMATKLESGIPEIIEHGVNGFTIPLDEVSNYANHIEQLHHNRSQLKKMSKLCIEKSEQLFNPKDQAKLLEDVLCKTEETKKHIKKNIFDFLPIVIANRIQNYFRK